jgi:hypothetical protein
MSTKYYQCPECGRVNKSDAVLDRGFKRVCSTHPNGIVHAWTDMIPVQVIPETPEPQPWDEIARTLGYEDRHDMQGALAACASYLRYPIAGVEHQHPNQLADELDKAVKAMETPKIPFHTVNPEEPYDGDLVWTADGRAWAFYAAKHGWNRAPERDRKPTPATPDDQKIERMARAMHGRLRMDWDEVGEAIRDIWRRHAKAALAALETPATPKLPEGVETLYDGPLDPADENVMFYECDGEVIIRNCKVGLKNGYRVTKQYILNKIQEDIENA